MIPLLNSCSDLQEEDILNADFFPPSGSILDEETLLGNDIYLPKGTFWYYTNNLQNEVVFELPEPYTFLLKNLKTDEYILSKEGGGYSCTCSSGGTCTVFYTKRLGYGCLQSDCAGSCTGKGAVIEPEFQIMGVLNAENDLLDANLKQEKASLSREGIEGFFKVKEIQEEVKRTYDFIYTHLEKPDFDSENYDTKKFVYAKNLLYGFELGLIIPNDPNLSEFFPDLEIRSVAEMDSPTSCTCSGGSQGGDCKLEKKALMGFVAYYCSGCSTCTMN